MNKEKLEMYKKMIKENQKKREKGNTKKPFEDVEKNLDKIVSDIDTKIGELKQKHTANKNKKEYKMLSIDGVPFDFIAEFTGKTGILEEYKNALEKEEINEEQFNRKVGILKDKLNISLRKKHIDIQSISYDTNEFRIRFELPDPFL